jgi:hypothetical protein
MHLAEGGDAQGGGGLHVHPVHPPWVRHCSYFNMLLKLCSVDPKRQPVKMKIFCFTVILLFHPYLSF